MKIGAHPMVVAVALGLLGPVALAEDGDEPSVAGCATCDGSCAAPCDDVEAPAASADPLSVMLEEAWVDMVDLTVDPT